MALLLLFSLVLLVLAGRFRLKKGDKILILVWRQMDSGVRSGVEQRKKKKKKTNGPRRELLVLEVP